MKALKVSLFLLFLLTACSDDEVLTSAQLTAKKLKNDIASHTTSLTYVSVVNIYSGSSIFAGSTAEITSDGFIVVTTDADASATFNLGELKSYRLEGSSLVLYY